MFDLGGVLIELDGAPPCAPGASVEVAWARWLSSPTVRAFESGSIDAETFADQMVSTLASGMTAERFLDQFVGWPIGPFDGALEMVARIPTDVVVATMSNTNELHWPIFMQMGLDGPFHKHFPSHETGLLKPDRAAFENVVASLGCAPDQILFLDDQLANVEGAQACGVNARQVSGVRAAELALLEFGILAPSE